MLTNENDNNSADILTTEPFDPSTADRERLESEIKIEETMHRDPEDANPNENNSAKSSKEKQILENIKCINMIMAGKFTPSLNVYQSNTTSPTASNPSQPFFNKNAILMKIENVTQQSKKKQVADIEVGANKFSQTFKRSLDPTPTNKQQMRKISQIFEFRREKSYSKKNPKPQVIDNKPSSINIITQPPVTYLQAKSPALAPESIVDSKKQSKIMLQTQKWTNRLSYRASPKKGRYPKMPSLKDLHSSGDEDLKSKKRIPSRSRESSANLGLPEKNSNTGRQSRANPLNLDEKQSEQNEAAPRKSHKKMLSVHIPNSNSNPVNGLRLNIQSGNHKVPSLTPGVSNKNSPSKKNSKKIQMPVYQMGVSKPIKQVVSSKDKERLSRVTKEGSVEGSQLLAKPTSDSKRAPELKSRNESSEHMNSQLLANQTFMPPSSPSQNKQNNYGKFSFKGTLSSQANKGFSFGPPKASSTNNSQKLMKANSGMRESSSSKGGAQNVSETPVKRNPGLSGTHPTKKSSEVDKIPRVSSSTSKMNIAQGSSHTVYSSTGGGITTVQGSFHQHPENISVASGQEAKNGDEKTLRKRFNNSISKKNSTVKSRLDQGTDSEIRIDVCVGKKNLPTFGEKLHNLGMAREAEEKSINSGNFSSKSFNLIAKSSRGPSEDKSLPKRARGLRKEGSKESLLKQAEPPVITISESIKASPENGEINSEPVEMKVESKTVRFTPQTQESTISDVAETFCEQLGNSKTYLIHKISECYQNNERLSNQNFYRVIPGKIGKGSFGKVYSAVSILTGESVAVKCLSLKAMRRKQDYNKIRREIAVHRQLVHPNIIRLFEVFETESNVYFVMEYANNGDLLSMVRKGHLQEEFAKKIIINVIYALENCHSKKILHRDVKLDNILLNKDGSVKICDFGISIFMEDNRLEYDQSGTPAYIAPEILRGDGYSGFKADVWSLGITIYTMLTGTIPFQARETEQLHALILEGVFDFPEHPKLSNEAKDLLRRILVLDPLERLSLEEVKMHPWFEPVFAGEQSKNLGSTEPLADERIISEIESYGFPRKFIEDTLLHKAINHVNACYSMLQLRKTKARSLEESGTDLIPGKAC